MFGMRSHHNRRHNTLTHHHQRHGFWHRVNPNRRAGGLQAGRSSTGRHSAWQNKLRTVGRGRDTHVPLFVRMKHFLGIRSRRVARR